MEKVAHEDIPQKLSIADWEASPAEMFAPLLLLQLLEQLENQKKAWVAKAACKVLLQVEPVEMFALLLLLQLLERLETQTKALEVKAAFEVMSQTEPPYSQQVFS